MLRMSEYGKGYYTVAVDFAYRYHMNVLGNLVRSNDGHVRGQRIYVYGTLELDPRLAIVEIDEQQYPEMYMRMCDLLKE